MPSGRGNNAGKLFKYLGEGVHGEVQQGAISGLSDVKGMPAAEALIGNLAHFSPGTRDLVLQGLVRDEQRLAALRQVVRDGKIRDLPPEVMKRLGLE